MSSTRTATPCWTPSPCAAATTASPAGAGTSEDSSGTYGLVLLHRFEFLGSPALVEQTFAVLLAQAPDPFLLVVDDHARHALRDRLETLPDRVRVTGKLDHAGFLDLLAGAAWTVTDSGGVQEECALLGVPTLVHRRATERTDGLGANALLSGWQPQVLAAFLEDPQRHRRPPARLVMSPSGVVADDLVSRYGSS